LIEQHRPYARALAVKIVRTLPVRVQLNDLVAYGELGLIEAADRYDPLRGASFTTFAYYRIRGAIYDGLREMGFLTRGAARQQRFAAAADDLLQSTFDDGAAARAAGVEPTIEDDIAAAQALIDALIPPFILSLDSEAVPEVADPNAFSAEQVERRELIRIVREVLAGLPEDERRLIDRIYFKHQSMTDLAAELGISKGWVSRLHARTIRRLHDGLVERGVLTPKD
jgi:RNA polymerase sigma factor for flagellar operon FliA